ncbi:uncharacterized protein LOC143247309 [Tachypleus tridentatus]|uniref:uncharacterized protein LOC143247309 n=1 Tax=Tachypleus tridentatus TaxID=6853 RepID=UPI003FD601A2
MGFVHNTTISIIIQSLHGSPDGSLWTTDREPLMQYYFNTKFICCPDEVRNSRGPDHSHPSKRMCPICGRIFSSQSNKIRHMRLHSVADWKHCCKMCEFSSTRRDALRHHMRVRHGYSADLC